MFKLLLGLYRPEKGTVTIGGVDVSQITDRQRRSCIGCVEQHFARVPGTVLDQITLGDPRITRDMARKAARLAGLDAAICAFPDGYDTRCTDGMFSQGEWQLLSIARSVQAAGAQLLRGGAYKPRTSPYSFSGLREEGLALLRAARRETGLPVVSEIMSATDLPLFEDVDVIQVGARNMQNFELLKELGKTDKPILLKRGLSATIEEWLMSAEYIMAGGNDNVILCERGIRTFETYTRNTLDLSAIPAVKKLSHLPIVIDPSHASGMWWMVEPMAKAAIAAGADGLIIEVHNDPEHALCDGAQSLKPERFAHLMGELKGIAQIIGREM